MTKQENYEQIVRLTSELHATNFAQEVFKAVENEDAEQFASVFETFKKVNSELYQRLKSFGDEFNKLKDSDKAIFGDEEDKSNGIFVFDANELDALSFYSLTFFGDIDEYFFFDDWPSESSERFLDAIEAAGYPKLADFIDNYSWSDDFIGEEDDQYPSLYELFIDVFKGEFEFEEDYEEGEYDEHAYEEEESEEVTE